MWDWNFYSCSISCHLYIQGFLDNNVVCAYFLWTVWCRNGIENYLLGWHKLASRKLGTKVIFSETERHSSSTKFWSYFCWIICWKKWSAILFPERKMVTLASVLNFENKMNHHLLYFTHNNRKTFLETLSFTKKYIN